MQIANNFDEFIEKVSEAERKALNMPAGQEMTKSEFMTFLFAMFVKETPEAMQEMGKHVYNELRKQEA